MKPALLIIDMQNDGIKPDSRLYCPAAVGLIPTINRLASTARAHNLPVIWVCQEHRRQLTDFGREADISPVHCVEDSYGAQLIDGLERLPQDYKVIKRRYSGFYNTDLEVLLRCLQVDTVVVTGMITDGCVLMTAMDAHARDFYVRVVSDGCATTDDETHQAALKMMARTQPGVVAESGEVEKLFAGSS